MPTQVFSPFTHHFGHINDWLTKRRTAIAATPLIALKHHFLKAYNQKTAPPLVATTAQGETPEEIMRPYVPLRAFLLNLSRVLKMLDPEAACQLILAPISLSPTAPPMAELDAESAWQLLLDDESDTAAFRDIARVRYFLHRLCLLLNADSADLINLFAQLDPPIRTCYPQPPDQFRSLKTHLEQDPELKTFLDPKSIPLIPFISIDYSSNLDTLLPRALTAVKILNSTTPFCVSLYDHPDQYFLIDPTTFHNSTEATPTTTSIPLETHHFPANPILQHLLPALLDSYKTDPKTISLSQLCDPAQARCTPLKSSSLLHQIVASAIQELEQLTLSS